MGMASTSGLPACGRRVCVGPPFSASGPRPGSPSWVSPVPPSMHDASSLKLNPFELIVPPLNSQFGPPCGNAITDPNGTMVPLAIARFAGPLLIEVLLTTVAYASVMSSPPATARPPVLPELPVTVELIAVSGRSESIAPDPCPGVGAWFPLSVERNSVTPPPVLPYRNAAPPLPFVAVLSPQVG